MIFNIAENADLDALVKLSALVKTDRALLASIKKHPDLIYPVDFQIFGRVSARDETDEIRPYDLRLAEPDGQEIRFACISARMFGCYRGITRGEFLSEKTFKGINQHLKKGRLSFCRPYDALLLWDELYRCNHVQEYWVGTRPLKTKRLRAGIFQLRYDDGRQLRLLLGDMYSNVTFSSQCPILLRYTPK